eukprot:4072659-Pleurochrysis_carterae.AAC.3
MPLLLHLRRHAHPGIFASLSPSRPTPPLVLCTAASNSLPQCVCLSQCSCVRLRMRVGLARVRAPSAYSLRHARMRVARRLRTVARRCCAPSAAYSRPPVRTSSSPSANQSCSRASSTSTRSAGPSRPARP